MLYSFSTCSYIELEERQKKENIICIGMNFVIKNHISNMYICWYKWSN